MREPKRMVPHTCGHCGCIGWSDRGLYEAERAIERRFDRLIRRVSVSEDAPDGE